MLEVESLNQFYGGSHILRDVKLTVPDGKLTVLLGRNGVGKTTLLRCLMGVVPTKSGTISWRGAKISSMPTYKRVASGLAYVPQGRDIFGRLTVEENLLVGAASRKARRTGSLCSHVARLSARRSRCTSASPTVACGQRASIATISPSR